MCADGYDDTDKADGICPDCGGPTVDGDAAERCNWSPVVCNTCNWTPCDGSC